MKNPAIEDVDRIRSFNRFYLRQTGVMSDKFLNDNLSLPEIRILFEIQHDNANSACQLAEQTLIDQGYISRLIKRLIKIDLLSSITSPDDARCKVLSLTASGKKMMAELEQKSRHFTADMISHLSPEERDELIGLMGRVQQLISPADKLKSVVIRPYRNGDIGTIINRHAILYAREYGWDHTFEDTVVDVFYQFRQQYDPNLSQLWVAEVDNQFAGCIAVMPEQNQTARLRTFLVEPKYRGLSIGRQLIEQCLNFTRQQGYKKVVLWTCAELTQAIKLYQLNGFKRIKSWDEERYGTTINNETWELVFNSQEY